MIAKTIAALVPFAPARFKTGIRPRHQCARGPYFPNR